jgi:alpha-mannosidase
LLTRTGDAGPAIATPEAQCLRDMEFRYGFFPHNGNRNNGKVTKEADLFNVEPLIWKTGIHNGVLASENSFFEVFDKNEAVSVSALKKSEDGSGIILRLYNNTDSDAFATISSTSY